MNIHNLLSSPGKIYFNHAASQRQPPPQSPPFNFNFPPTTTTLDTLDTIWLEESPSSPFSAAEPPSQSILHPLPLSLLPEIALTGVAPSTSNIPAPSSHTPSQPSNLPHASTGPYLDVPSLQEQGVTSWADRNPNKSIQPTRPRTKQTENDATKANKKIRAAHRAEDKRLLNAEIKAIISARDALIHEAAKKFSVSVTHVEKAVNATSNYKPSRKPNLFNALVSEKKEMNDGSVLLTFIHYISELIFIFY